LSNHIKYLLLIILLIAGILSDCLAVDSLKVNKKPGVDSTIFMTLPERQGKFKPIDSMIVANPLKIDSVGMSKSPWGALWRSFVLPGWGQLYVHSYWKAPVFLIGSGSLVYFYIWNNVKYNKYQTEYDNAKNSGQITPELTNTLDSISRYKEYYRDNRDQCAFYFFGVYALAAIDAYVGAHLFDFDVSDKMSIQILPNIGYGFKLNLNFKR